MKNKKHVLILDHQNYKIEFREKKDTDKKFYPNEYYEMYESSNVTKLKDIAGKVRQEWLNKELTVINGILAINTNFNNADMI